MFDTAFCNVTQALRVLHNYCVLLLCNQQIRVKSLQPWKDCKKGQDKKLSSGDELCQQKRHRWDSNSRGETPADFESAALTARPRCPMHNFTQKWNRLCEFASAQSVNPPISFQSAAKTQMRQNLPPMPFFALPWEIWCSCILRCFLGCFLW
jgi:hypothetical protein